MNELLHVWRWELMLHLEWGLLKTTDFVHHFGWHSKMLAALRSPLGSCSRITLRISRSII